MELSSKDRLNGLMLDVAVIGSGFAGLYALHKLRNESGLNAQGFDDAGGVGGTWYWNRYPGCRCDTEAFVYMYSFDRELAKTWKWSERYPYQSEVLAYLNTVADRHDLARSINFNTRIVKADWDEAAALWRLTTANGEVISAQFVVEGVGLLSSTNFPNFKGIDRFKGQIHHSARWPHEGVDLKGKRVGVIGTGSTGIQIISEVGPECGQLFVFQRTAQYVVPSQHGPIPQKMLDWMRNDYEDFYKWTMNSATVFGINESSTSAMSVSPEERERVYEDAWNRGGGFGFMLATFGDIVTSREANDTATDFIRRKIRTIVKDPTLAEKLCPKDLYAKRPLCCDDYYETFNRDNVTLVDVKSDPIDTITEKGIRLSSGREIELDVIVLATGFDAVSGNYLKIDTTGRNGLKLKDKWVRGPNALIGLTIAGFPNLFMIFGPFGPFTSQPLVHEWQVNWIADAITTTRERGMRIFEAEQSAEDDSVTSCNAVAEMTLFPLVDSWINGANVAGKPKGNMFYMAGMANYAKEVEQMVADGYRGFRIHA